MTNTNSQLPAHLQGYQGRGLATKLAGNLGAGSPPFISIMGGRFTKTDVAGNQTPIETFDPRTGVFMDCVIVDVGDHISKIYYAHDFDPSAAAWSPPDCWSDNGVAPSVNASSPQARSCTPDETGQAGCRWAVWGSKTSKITGKGVPACGSYQKIALIFPNDPTVWLLRIPPNSLTSLREYISRFVNQPIELEMVVTRVSFDVAQGAKLGLLLFQAMDFVDTTTMERVKSLGNATDILVGRTDQPRLALPAPTGFQPNPTPAALAAGAPTPNAAFPLTATAPLPQTVQPAPAAAPSSAPMQPAPRRRGRPAAPQAAPAPQQPAFQPAPFRPAAPAAPAVPAQPSQFGMASSVAPNPELKGMLDNVFGQNPPGAS